MVPLEMGALKTKTISTRVPVALAEAVEADAKQLGDTPAGLLHSILKQRYALLSTAQKSNGAAQSPNTGDFAWGENHE